MFRDYLKQFGSSVERETRSDCRLILLILKSCLDTVVGQDHIKDSIWNLQFMLFTLVVAVCMVGLKYSEVEI